MTPSVPRKSNQTPTTPVAEPAAEPAAPAAASAAPASMAMTPAADNPLAHMPSEIRTKVVSAIKEWRDNVVANSEHVGSKFAEEARKIHFKEAEERPIYGEASAEEVQELLEEGVECAPLPILPEDHN